MTPAQTRAEAVVSDMAGSRFDTEPLYRRVNQRAAAALRFKLTERQR